MRQKTKKLRMKLALLLGFLVCMIAIVLCFQNAYAGEENNNAYAGEECNWFSGDFDDPLGALSTKDGTEERFNSIPECNDLLNKKFVDQSYMKINFFKDCDMQWNIISVPKDKTYEVNLQSHDIHTKAYNVFYVEGNLIFNGSYSGEHAKLSPYCHIAENNGGSVDIKYFDFDATPIVNHNLRHDSVINIENCSFTGFFQSAIDIFENQENSCPKVNITNCEFKNCTTTMGVIYLGWLSYNINLTVNNCTFSDCKSSSGGGILYDYETTKTSHQIVFNNSTIKNCHAEKGGGVVYFGTDKQDSNCKYNLSFNNSTIENCSSDKCGGVIADDGGQVNIKLDNTSIDGCSCQGKGGAVYITARPAYVNFANNSIIKKCSSKKEGGAIAAIGDLTLINFDNTKIESCQAGNDGGAIYMKGSYSYIVGTTGDKALSNLGYKGENHNTSVISNCSTKGGGGAIYTSAATNCGNGIDIKNIDFINNTSEYSGGAIETEGKDNLIKDCCFEGNKSNVFGGAIYGYSNAFWDAKDEPQVKNCEFHNNHAGRVGNQFMLTYVRLSNVCNNRFYYKYGSFNPGDDENIEKEFCTDHDKDPVKSTFKAICDDPQISGKVVKLAGKELPITSNCKVDFLQDNGKGESVLGTALCNPENGEYQLHLPTGSEGITGKLHVVDGSFEATTDSFQFVPGKVVNLEAKHQLNLSFETSPFDEKPFKFYNAEGKLIDKPEAYEGYSCSFYIDENAEDVNYDVMYDGKIIPVAKGNNFFTIDNVKDQSKISITRKYLICGEVRKNGKLVKLLNNGKVDFVDNDGNTIASTEISQGYSDFRLYVRSNVSGKLYAHTDDSFEQFVDMHITGAVKDLQLNLKPHVDYSKVEISDPYNLVGEVIGADGNLMPKTFNVEFGKSCKFKFMLNQPWMTPNVVLNGQKLIADKDGFYTVNCTTDIVKIEVSL